MSAIWPLTWNNPISGCAKMITGIAMIGRNEYAEDDGLLEHFLGVVAIVRTDVARDQRDGAGTDRRDAGAHRAEDLRGKADRADRFRAETPDHQHRSRGRESNRVRTTESRATRAPIPRSGSARSVAGSSRPRSGAPVSGTDSRNSDMIVNSYASTRGDSQWTARDGGRASANRGRSCARAKSAISRAGADKGILMTGSRVCDHRTVSGAIDRRAGRLKFSRRSSSPPD